VSDVAVAQPEQELHHSGAPRAPLDEAQAEQALWQEFRDHGASINNAPTEALRIQGDLSIRLFEVGVLHSTRRLFLILFSSEHSVSDFFPRVPDRCLQELQSWTRARYNRITQLSSKHNWYRGQHDALDALVEALRTDNGWLEYQLRAVQDALLDQRTQTIECSFAVDRVKTVLLERDGAPAVENSDLQKARAVLAEVQTAMAEKETALAMVQTQLQQVHATLEGAQSWQVQAEQKAKEAERLGVDLQEKATSLATVEEQLRQEQSARQQEESRLQQE
jgi:hypothetical protein